MSGGVQLENANPVIFQRSGDRMLTASEEDEDSREVILCCLGIICLSTGLCTYIIVNDFIWSKKTSHPSQNDVSTSSDESRIMSFGVKCLKTFHL
uniref:Uncharacterized protein n=1 Tax=Poecilia latipinna TaxID=48699 RepID=A0A3B3VGQ6_9TELE